MTTKRTEVYDGSRRNSAAEACAAAWRGRLAYFSFNGHVYFVLGPGTSPDDWHDTEMRASELGP